MHTHLKPCPECGRKYEDCDRCREEEDDEREFIPCDKCDGHPACEDFGCAIELGLGRMVRKNLEPGIDDWG